MKRKRACTLNRILLLVLAASVSMSLMTAIASLRLAADDGQSVSSLLMEGTLPKPAKQGKPDAGSMPRQDGADPDLVMKAEAMPLPRPFSFSFCVMIKDDNDIINEWIAYHYHTLNLRRMIVAIDPSSKTSPSTLFQRWRDHFGMSIIEWSDADYMPSWLNTGIADSEYNKTREPSDDARRKIPSFLPPREKKTDHIWFSHLSDEEASDPGTQKWMDEVLEQINFHRFRQVTFLAECAKSLKAMGNVASDVRAIQNPDGKNKDGANIGNKLPLSASQPEMPNWMAHVDTDEYIVPNPLVHGTQRLGGLQPERPTAGSLAVFIDNVFRDYPKRLSRSCVMMPSLQFGNKEYDDLGKNQTQVVSVVGCDDNGNTHDGEQIHQQRFAVKRFESIRWRYHAKFDDPANGMTKAILDLSHLSPNDDLLGDRAFSVHRPSKTSCRQTSLIPETSAVRMYPLVVHHYAGSLERYSKRSDIRRRSNPDLYYRKANATASFDEAGWIVGWLDEFVYNHGMDKVTKVLGKDFGYSCDG
mmetsp:Transcript_2734/g.7616  ORF Transcript_2734/g.7616 Transcript_2734/m.7616 type:complete len:528 (-) Transcript_2734:193-1776(-)